MSLAVPSTIQCFYTFLQCLVVPKDEFSFQVLENVPAIFCNQLFNSYKSFFQGIVGLQSTRLHCVKIVTARSCIVTKHDGMLESRGAETKKKKKYHQKISRKREMIIILHWSIVVFASMERNSNVSMNLNCVVLLGVLLTPLSLFQCGPCTIRNTSSLRVSGQCAHLPAKHQVRGVDTCIHSARQKKENKENDVNAIQQLKSTSYRGGGYSEKLITELSDFTRVQCGCVTVQGKQIRGSNQAHDQIPCGFSGTITLTSQKTRERISVEDTFL